MQRNNNNDTIERQQQQQCKTMACDTHTCNKRDRTPKALFDSFSHTHIARPLGFLSNIHSFPWAFVDHSILFGMDIRFGVQHRGVGSSLLTTWYMTSDTTVPRTFYDHRHFWSARHQKEIGRILSTFKNFHISWKSISTRYYHHGHHFAH